MNTNLAQVFKGIRLWVNSKLSTKLDTLVSGTNIKTINSTSILGSGDIQIQGGDYPSLSNKPLINGVTLSGNKTTSDLGITIPTKTSQLTNDSGFLTSHLDISGKENTSNKVSSWSTTTTNTHYPSEKLVKDEIDNVRAVAAGKTKTFVVTGTATSPWNTLNSTITVSLSNIPGASTLDDIKVGDNILLEDLEYPDRWIMSKASTSNIVCPILETAKVDLSNYLTKITSSNKLAASLVSGLATVATSGAYSDLSGKPSLSTVATSGSYNDLSNKPTIPAAQIQSNWTQTDTSALDYIKNKPTLSAVATSGSYNDLSNKPTIPTQTSQLTNNSGFVTLSTVYSKTEIDALEAQIAQAIATRGLNDTTALPASTQKGVIEELSTITYTDVVTELSIIDP